jgi:putative Holliday junction resolvase
MKGPVLALDLGTRRIGLAVSDPDATLAFPAGHLDRQGRLRDLEALQALAREREVSCIVVGLPIHMDGSRGKAAEAAREFATALANHTSLPVELLDERWTTVEAERALRDAPRSRKRRKGTVDALAATLLLRTWLERSASPGAGGEA